MICVVTRLDATQAHRADASGPRVTNWVAKTSARNGGENQLHRKGQHGVGTDRIAHRRADTLGGHRPNIPQTRLGDHRFRAIDEPQGTGGVLVLRLADRH